MTGCMVGVGLPLCGGGGEASDERRDERSVQPFLAERQRQLLERLAQDVRHPVGHGPTLGGERSRGSVPVTRPF